MTTTHPTSDAALALVAVTSTFLAAGPWLRAFPLDSALPLLLGASVLSVVVPFAAARSSRAPTLLATAGSAVLLVVFLLVAVVHDPTRPAELVEGITQGTSRLLSTALPIVQPRWMLVLPVALCWVTGTAASELARRLRAPGWAIVVWMAGVVVACALTTGGGRADLAATVPLTVSCGLLVLVDRWRSAAAGGGWGPDTVAGANDARPWGPVRSVAAGAALLLLVTAAIAVGLPAAPALRGVPVAFHRQPDLHLLQPIAPPVAMAELRYGIDGPEATPIFSVRTSVTVPAYVTVAVLDTYTGSGWTLGDTFRPSGGTIPDPDGPESPGPGPTPRRGERPLATRTVTYVTVRHSPGLPWMAYVGRPEAVSGIDVAFDPRSGMILPSGPLANGERYTVTSETPTRTLASLRPTALARGIGASDDPADLDGWQGESADLATYVQELATDIGRSPAPSLRFLEAVAAYLRTEDRQIAPPADAATHGVPPTGSDADFYGTSFAAVAGAVMSSAHRATPEQFATFFVLLARSLGIPARLATGYRVVGADGSAASLRAGHSTTVTAGDAWTWAEVPVAGTGWVIVDPTPHSTGAAPPTPARASAPAATPPHQAHAVSTPGAAGHALAPRVRLRRPLPVPGHPFPLGLAVGGGTIAVALLALATVAATKSRRCWRRRHAAARGSRVEGAWLETLDRLDEATLTGLGALTGVEIVDRVQVRLGPDVAGPVATITSFAEVAVFAGESALAPDAGEIVWQAHDAMRLAIRRRQRPGARLAAIVRTSRHHWG